MKTGVIRTLLQRSRHICNSEVQEAGSGTCYRPNIPSRNLGFVITKCPGPYSVHRVPWILSELSSTRTEPSSGEGETQHLLEGNQIIARKLSQLLGRLQAATRAVPLAPLFYQKLQQALQRALDQDYSA